KEINELFLDSGLGKNAYNIISQGEVDEVLKARPEQRRNMIEETAGVMKYKVRKNESEKRLEETRSNLSRVHDIISELDSRVGRLERGSANGKEYLALKEEMAKSDIEVTIYDINELLTSLENEESGYRKAEAEVEAHNRNVADMNRRISDVSKRRDEYDQEN